MSKYTGPFAGVGLLALALAANLPGAAEPKHPEAVAKAARPVEIFRAREPIRIDGDLDDAAWKEARPVEVVYAWGKVGERSPESCMVARYAWDEDYLYIGYETFDKNLVALGSGEKEGPKGNEREGCLIAHPTEKVDVVEFFLSCGDPRIFWELHHNAANQFNDVLCTVADPSWPVGKSSLFRFGIYFGQREYLQDDAENGKTFARAVRLKPKADGKPSTVNDPSDVDTGYTGEMRIPWLGLGAPLSREAFTRPKSADGKARPARAWKMAGQEMMILAVSQNNDLKDFYHHSSPTKPGGWFHVGAAEHWNRYVLVEAK